MECIALGVLITVTVNSRLGENVDSLLFMLLCRLSRVRDGKVDVTTASLQRKNVQT